MPDHFCLHESEIAVLKMKLESIENGVDDILVTLKGNGKPGICTEVALLRDRQTWIWVALSGTGSILVGIAGYILRGLIS
jgi:hypothetical protein